MIAFAVVAWIAFVNIVTLWRFREDKRRAVDGLRRIPEADLLRWALLGGTPAAYAARRIYRHKTRKQPFGLRLDLIAMMQAGVTLGLGFAFLL